MKRKILYVLLCMLISPAIMLGCEQNNFPSSPNIGIDSGQEKVNKNLAVGGTTKASGEAPGNGAASLVNGKMKGQTEFYSSVNGNGEEFKDHEEWVQIKLPGSSLKINEIWLYPRYSGTHEGFPLDFMLQTSIDGTNWTTVVTKTDYPEPKSAEPQRFSFETVNAKYIRLVATRLYSTSSKWTGNKDVFVLQLSEIEVYMRTSSVLSVRLNSYIGITKVENSVIATVKTTQITSGTEINAELVTKEGEPLSKAVKQPGQIRDNATTLTLKIPDNMPAGNYKVKVTIGSKSKGIHALSEIYYLADQGNKIYYVSSGTGNDNNDGLSPEKPIKTLAKASRLQLKAGEKLLLKSGDTWIGESFLPQGSGTGQTPIIISSYGTGDRPHLIPGFTKMYGIRLVNAEGYKITNIEVSGCYGGVVVWTENTYNHKYLWIENCYFHDITGKDTGFCAGSTKNLPPDLLYGMGVSICGSDAYGGSNLFSDITITKCEFDRCDVGIEVIGRDHDETGAWKGHGHNKITSNAFRNINIKDCNILHSYRTGGIMLYCTTGGTAKNVLIDQTGYQGVGMYWGVAAFQVARVSDYLVENCTFSNTIKGTSPDGQGFDFESDNHNVTVRNCKFLHNDGPAVLYYGESWPGENEGCVVDGAYMEGNNKTNYYGNVVFGIGKPKNDGIVKNTEIHLLNDSQSFSCFPMIFDPSNRVYNSSNNLIYSGGPSHYNPLFTDDFSNGLSKWKNASGATSNGNMAKLKNAQLMYVSNGTAWKNYFVETELSFESNPATSGVAFYIQDLRNYYLLKWKLIRNYKSVIELYKVVNNEEGQPFVQFECAALKEKSKVRIEIADNKIKTYIDGNLIGEASDAIYKMGTAGLWQGPEGQTSFSKFFIGALKN